MSNYDFTYGSYDRSEYLDSLNIVQKTVGRCRVPDKWNGAKLSLVSCRHLQESHWFRIITGRKKKIIEEDDYFIYASFSSLDLSGIDLSSLKLGSRYQIRDRLMHLHLQYNSLSPESIQGIFEHIPPNLQTCELGGNDIGDELLVSICSRCPKAIQNLYKIGLCDSMIGDRAIEALCNLLKFSPNLEELCVARNEITNRGALVLANELLRCNYYAGDEDTEAPPLERLDISWTLLTDIDVLLDLTLAGQHKPTFTTLSFHGNHEVCQEAEVDEVIIDNLLKLENHDMDNRKAISSMAVQRDVPLSCRFNCGTRHIQKRIEERHYERLCPKRPFPCEYCSNWVSLETKASHELNECLEYPFYCLYVCGAAFHRKEGNFQEARSNHERSECPERPVHCELGCSIDSLLAKQRESHYENDCPDRIVHCKYVEDCENPNVKAKDMEDHIKAHRDVYAQKLINAEEKSRDGLGSENNYARQLFKDIAPLCEHIGLSVAERERRRREKQDAIAKEAQSIKRAVDEAKRKKRKEAFETGKKCFILWTEFVPRACSNEGCSEQVLDKVFNTHLAECPHRIVPCSFGCGEKLKHKNVDFHTKNDCMERNIFCNRDGCQNRLIKAKDRDKHDREYHTKIKRR